MRSTVEHRIVEMKFNNEEFEKKVSNTMSTLDKLKEKLNFTGATKGLENIKSISDKMHFTGMTNAIDSIRTKFSAMEVMSITALTNIANSAVNAGKRIVSALTIDPIKTGFSEYETKINAIQTIMSNTSSKGTTMDDVTKTLDELNTYADKTIYNFAEMTRNIGTFTAAGIGLEDSASAIQGIANLAAASGSNSQQASTAMYQLSQAMAAGSVKLMDWNSVVNAGMGGQKFQEALKATARDHGIAVDALIKKNGSFRESLQEGWITADILNETLNKFTVKGAKEYAAAMMESGKWTQAQADALIAEAQSMEDAATKVKTFSQLWSTLQESAQSGWSQSWEIIIGNFEEAKELLTNISDTIGGVIGRSADARNKMLQDWKDLGGRKALVDALSNAFEGIGSIVKPISEAFREIFPPMTGKKLLEFSEGLKNLTAKMKLSEDTAKKLKSIFKGVFSVVDVALTVVTTLAKAIFKLLGNFTGIIGVLFKGTAAIGDFASGVRDSIENSNAFGKAVNKVVDFLQNGIDKVKEFGSEMKAGFAAKGYEGFVGFLKAVWEFISMIGKAVGTAFGGLGKAIANAFGGNSLGEALSTGGFTAFIIAMFQMVNNLNKPLKSMSEMFEKLTGKKGILTNVAGILDDVRGCFKAYQEQLKAGTLVKIATAIGILAAAIFTISTIEPETLGQSLAAITALFGELLISMTLFAKIPKIKGALRASVLMTSMATSLLILAGAMKIIGLMKPGEMITGLVGIAGSMAVLVGALHLMPDEKKFNKATRAIRSMSISLLILSGALKIMGSMKWEELAKGLVGAAVGLGIMVGALWLLPKDLNAKTFGMIGMATALVIMGTALKTMGSMSWIAIGKGLTVLAGSLTAITLALRLMPKNMIKIGIGLIGVSTALVILSKALKSMGSMSWEEIGKGLTVLGGSLLILSVALIAMKKSLAGSAALLVAASAITVLSLALRLMGGMSWESIGKSLVMLAGSLAIIGAAGALLAPVIPALLGLSATFVLFGVAAVALGAGLGLIATGITLLGAALATGATAIVAGLSVLLTGILGLIPAIFNVIGDAILSFCKVIGDCAPAIADSILKLIAELLKSLATYTPIIANSLFDLLIGILDVLSARMPELISSVVKVINGFFVGVADALSDFDGANLLKGAIAVAIMSALVYALAGVSSMIGPAMIGLLGVGALIAELALVLAAIGALNKIPGFADLVSSGGNLLEKIGTAIGQFVGGLAGGIAQGFTNSLPEIARDLSDFMIEIQPFVDGARDIDKGVITGVASLVAAVGAVTVAGFGQKIADFLTIGKTPLEKFAEQIVALGKGMKAYGKEVAGVDASAIMASAFAAKALTEVANAIPKSGGLFNIFTGSDSLLSFAIQLVPFGACLKKYASTVSGIDVQAIKDSASAAKALAEMANVIPNSGGMVAWFTGDNSLAKFSDEIVKLGTGLKGFSEETAGIVPENIKACSDAAKTLAEMMSIIPNEGGMVAWFTGENSVTKFADNLTSLGTGLKAFSEECIGIVPEHITACTAAAKTLAEMFSVIPNEGGMVAWFTGENSVAKFAGNLKSLGTGLKDFSTETVDIKPENVVAAADAAKSLAEMANTIPNEGGVVSWFAGDNSIATFAGNLKPLGTGLKEFSLEVADLKPENVTAAANAAKALAEMVSIVPNEGGIKAWFTGENAVSTFASNLKPLGTGLKEFSTEIGEIKPDSVTAAANAAKALAEMANTTPKDTDKIISFGTNLVTFGEKLKAYFEKTTGITSDAVKVSKEAIDMVKSATSGFNAEVMSGVSDAIDKLVKSLKNMSSVSVDSIKGFTDAMAELGKVEVKTITESFNNAATQLEDIGKNIIDGIIKGIRSKDEDIKTAGTESATKVGDGLAADNEDLITGCTTLVTNCATAIKDQRKHFYNAGGYLVEGFANGITADTYKAKAAAKAMAKAAREAAEKELDINSPSDVFYDIGLFTGEGFINALKDSAKNVYNASGSMAESARKGMQAAINKVMSLFDNNLDTQPTIRPVLDLSDIQAGASTIGSMLGNVGIGANLNAISASMNSRIQNGVNDDVVSAINKLGKVLGNTSGDTYNINGVSVDDDGSVRDAVQTIIRAAKVERRI